MGYIARSYLKGTHIFRLYLIYIYDNQPNSTVLKLLSSVPAQNGTADFQRSDLLTQDTVQQNFFRYLHFTFKMNKCGGEEHSTRAFTQHARRPIITSSPNKQTKLTLAIVTSVNRSVFFLKKKKVNLFQPKVTRMFSVGYLVYPVALHMPVPTSNQLTQKRNKHGLTAQLLKRAA